MKDTIREYLPLGKQRKEELWTNATFVFDTNVLLNLYRYSKNTREALINAIRRRKERVFMPYHIAYEFMRRRCDIIYETADSSELKAECEAFFKHAQNVFRLSKDDTHFVELKEYIQTWIERQRTENLLVRNPAEDAILDEILDIYDSKIGCEEAQKELGELYERGKERYEQSIPPGYKDDKKDENKYGDYIIWTEIIRFSKDQNKDIILVTGDKKEDWWQIVRGRTIGPRTELKKEFYNETSHEFSMYTMENFLELCKGEQGETIDSAIINEVIEVSSVDNYFPNLPPYPPYYYQEFSDLDMIDMIRRKRKVEDLTAKIAREQNYINTLYRKYGEDMPYRVQLLYDNTIKKIHEHERELEKLSQEMDVAVG